ncbi:hypothetical protein SBRCBS47491_005033 [Sporothrix bragantina]|uniref:HORMA domain-containing protein n=1 Tax=Sporothrix bragantina TaxID=671064 RepID=A0ABP0BV58_9PEZI
MASLSLDEAAQLYSTLHHFFEVAVHAVLYYRRLYPERAFVTATAFDVPVHQSRHPAVCAWVRAAVEQVMVQIAGGNEPATKEKEKLPTEGVNAVAVVVHAPYQETFGNSGSLPAGAVLERWVFDVRHLPKGWPGGIEALRRVQTDRNKREGRGDGESIRREGRRARRRSPEKAARGPGGGNGGDDGNSRDEARYNYYDEEEELANAESEAELDDDDAGAGDDVNNRGDGYGAVNWTDLNDQLRGVLQRLAQAGQQVADLPDGCTFTVAIELGDGDDNTPETDGARRRMDTNWIPETGVRKQQSFGSGAAAAGASTTSVRSVDSAPLYLECWVEESAVKNAAAKGATPAQLAATAGSDTDAILPPPQEALLSTATTASYKDDMRPKSNKGKTVAFS